MPGLPWQRILGSGGRIAVQGRVRLGTAVPARGRGGAVPAAEGWIWPSLSTVSLVRLASGLAKAAPKKRVKKAPDNSQAPKVVENRRLPSCCRRMAARKMGSKIPAVRTLCSRRLGNSICSPSLCPSFLPAHYLPSDIRTATTPSSIARPRPALASRSISPRNRGGDRPSPRIDLCTSTTDTASGSASGPQSSNETHNSPTCKFLKAANPALQGNRIEVYPTMWDAT